MTIKENESLIILCILSHLFFRKHPVTKSNDKEENKNVESRLQEADINCYDGI